MADQLGSPLRWGRRLIREAVVVSEAENVDKRSLKLRVRLLVRARLVLALVVVVVVVRSVVVLVKLRSRSVSGNNNVGSSMVVSCVECVREWVLVLF